MKISPSHRILNRDIYLDREIAIQDQQPDR